MRRRLLLVLVAAVLVTVVPATAASAHGEKSQEGFLRMRTVGWTDVQFSGDTVQQEQTATVSGTVKIMDAWPSSLAKGQPNTCFMSMIAPGPVIVLKERTINGESMPTRIDCTKGRAYDFSMTFAGRRVGRWHVHPAFAVKGAGTLIGPGAWINVQENPAGFTNEATLLGGLQSGMGYLGARTLVELRAKARFIRVTPAGQREAAPHDVVEIKTQKA